MDLDGDEILIGILRGTDGTSLNIKLLIIINQIKFRFEGIIINNMNIFNKNIKEKIIINYSFTFN